MQRGPAGDRARRLAATRQETRPQPVHKLRGSGAPTPFAIYHTL